MSFKEVPVNLFSTLFRGKEFSSLKKNIIRARMYVPVEDYLSVALLSSILVTVFCVIGFLLVKIFLPINILIILFALLLIPTCTFAIFYFYPNIKAWERGRKINVYLPYAIGYISSMAEIGVVPYVIFKTLAEAEESYGEVSREAKQIVRDVELLGYDLITALRNLAVTTPSTSFRTFIQGAITSVTSGGEMGRYFLTKAEEFMEENRRRYTDFISTLGIISEVYITGMVAGPLFIIVMFAAMTMVGGASPMTLAMIIYMFIPVGTLMFLLLIDSISPEKG